MNKEDRKNLHIMTNNHLPLQKYGGGNLIKEPYKPSSIGWRIAFIIGCILIVIVSILLCLPVVLLPLSTAVPAWTWILLAAADLALILLSFRLKPANRARVILLGGLILVCVVAIAASQVFAATPAITGPDGKPVPGSIAVLEKVTLNGAEQWITIRGQDARKPVLLNLGMGGPGGGGFATRTLFEPLEKDFVVVSWDEPGTGKSYNAVPISTLTPQRFIEDAHALTQYLCHRFGQGKIYVYGTSWTSILGVWLVQKYPDLYYAYIGNGQMVNTTEDDQMGYELALKYLAEKGDTALLDKLHRNGPPPYKGPGLLDSYVAYLDVLNEVMGAPHYTVVVPIVPFLAPEYGFVDKINHTRGLIESFTVVYPQLGNLDFMTQAARLEVPVYIFAGRDDVNAMSSLVESYYNRLEAPHKTLIWLEGGHGLGDENLTQFVDVMTRQVLSETYSVR
jgi:pimeloyl-ACP methyl ester carboxylesterase